MESVQRYCFNFFGIYCSVFVVGVGFACKTNIVPLILGISFKLVDSVSDLPLSADVLFYVLHRAVHSKVVATAQMHHE